MVFVPDLYSFTIFKLELYVEKSKNKSRLLGILKKMGIVSWRPALPKN